ncbi:DNA-processing protein DprA [Polaribacter sp.]|nr:DNA-processing protein DprA [Polaribacter sp.]
MNDEKLLAILRLQKCKAVGDISAKKLIANIGNVEQIFKEKASTLQKINGIGSHVTKYLFDNKNVALAEEELANIKKNKVSFSYFLDEDYPTHLQHCIDSPILIFKDGNFNFKDRKVISIVGTRNITSYGTSFCEGLVEALAPHNPIIVSGFAYGVDICAHKSAIKNNLETVAVLAHGLGQIYPKVHKKYVHQVVEKGGFITDFWYKENPLREHFLKRNRIVAGIADAVVIIESAEKGGSLVTAEIANSYDKDVFAVPGRSSDKYSKGCNNLIKNNRAHLLSDASDLVKHLNWDLQKKPKVIQKQLFISLTQEEQKVYDILKEKDKATLDEISKWSKIPIFKLSSLLLQLELKGVTKPLPGKQFALV